MSLSCFFISSHSSNVNCISHHKTTKTNSEVNCATVKVNILHIYVRLSRKLIHSTVAATGAFFAEKGKLNLWFKVSVSALVKPKQDEALFSSVAIPQVTMEQMQ